MSILDLLRADVRRGRRRAVAMPDLRANRRADHQPPPVWSDGTPVLPGGQTVFGDTNGSNR